jgi:hypothetical protein
MRLLIIISLITLHSVSFGQSIMNIHMNNGSVDQIPVNEIDSITYTIAALPTVQTNQTISTTNSSTIVYGEVIANGGTAVTSRGFCWGVSSFPTLSNFNVSSGSGIGQFSSLIAGLNSNTTYYIRAYAINSLGPSYGNELTVTTSAGVITLSTLGTGTINVSDAFINATITDDEGVTPTSRGFCYSTNSNPTISNQTVNAGSGIGNFTANLNSLIGGTTYYVKAFATNATGTYYGNQISFTTLSVSVDIGTPGLAGGTIFYDKGYYSNGWRYLEVMNANIIGTLPWSLSPNQIVNTPATVLGEGDLNTYNIVAIYGTGNYAASLCSNSTNGGYSDWYLPNVNEFLMMRQNLGPLTIFTGNFYHWTSEGVNVNDAVFMTENLDFVPSQQTTSKTTVGRCRCIRRY